MSRATLEFTLPDEREEHVRAVHACAAWACLEDLDATLRSTVKYGGEFKTVEQLAAYLRGEIADVQRLIDR